MADDFFRSVGSTVLPRRLGLVTEAPRFARMTRANLSCHVAHGSLSSGGNETMSIHAGGNVVTLSCHHQFTEFGQVDTQKDCDVVFRCSGVVRVVYS